MNYKVDTTMIPHQSFFRVCLSCWSKLPSCTRMPAEWWTTGYRNPMITCSKFCGLKWAIAANRQYSNTKTNSFNIEENPYFEKYKSKFETLKRTDPEKYAEKVKEIIEKEKEMTERHRKDLSTPPEIKKSKTGSSNTDDEKFTGSWPPKNLNELMKVDLIKDKSAEEIEQIWNEYHVTKDCIFGVIKEEEYDSVRSKANFCPLFIYPLPRNDGFEFILSQFSGKDIYFTPLGIYQTMKENAPPCLTVAHFTEFKEDKGIVLMAGQYDDKILTKNESLNLMKQMTIYYGKSSTDKFNAVRIFNHLPDKFNHLDLIENYKLMKKDLEHYYT